MRPGFPPGPTGDLLGSTLGVRETDSCWTIHSSVGSLVLEHDWRNSSGTSDGGCRMPASLAGTGTDRGGACEDGGWRTDEEEEEDRKAATGDRPGVL